MNLTRAGLQKNISCKTSRSGGKGGQNVNKVSTKVELLFAVNDSVLFTGEEKELLNEKLRSRLNKDGLVQIICDEERSQYLNKEIALERLIKLLAYALTKPNVRKAARINKTAKASRLHDKKLHAAKKTGRKRDFDIS